MIQRGALCTVYDTVGTPLSPSESEVSQRDIAANAGGKDNSED